MIFTLSQADRTLNSGTWRWPRRAKAHAAAAEERSVSARPRSPRSGPDCGKGEPEAAASETCGGRGGVDWVDQALLKYSLLVREASHRIAQRWLGPAHTFAALSAMRLTTSSPTAVRKPA